MNTATINIKTDTKTKKEAMAVAKEMGVSLTSVLNRYLKHFVKTKTEAINEEEIPSDYLKKTLKKAESNLKKGKGSPTFDNADDAITWLEKQGI